MEFHVWMLWLGLAALCIIGEIFTAGFFLLWFGIGAGVACLMAVLGVGIVWQWIGFILVSGVLFAISRKFAERITKKQPQGIGADRAIGKRGIVLEEIDNAKNTGRVRVEKEEWNADSKTGEVIKTNTRVVVTHVEGAHLIVQKDEEGD